jgi:hypothetical protein
MSVTMELFKKAAFAVPEKGAVASLGRRSFAGALSIALALKPSKSWALATEEGGASGCKYGKDVHGDPFISCDDVDPEVWETCYANSEPHSGSCYSGNGPTCWCASGEGTHTTCCDWECSIILPEDELEADPTGGGPRDGIIYCIEESDPEPGGCMLNYE